MCNLKTHISLGLTGYHRTRLDRYPPPDVPLALIDGLLPITALNAPLDITFPLPPDAGLHYSYRLLWEGEEISEERRVVPGGLRDQEQR